MRDDDGCRMLLTMGAMGAGYRQCHGCDWLKVALVLRSAAGFYVGTLEEGLPKCRITRYYSTYDEAEKAKEEINAYQD